MSETVGYRIRQYVSDHGLKYTWLARRIGIDQATLYSALRGRRSMNVVVYARICGALGVPLDRFIQPIPPENHEGDAE